MGVIDWVFFLFCTLVCFLGYAFGKYQSAQKQERKKLNEFLAEFEKRVQVIEKWKASHSDDGR